MLMITLRRFYGSTSKVEILIFFNPELQLKDAEFAIENKIMDLLTEIKGFRFVTTFALGSRK